MKNRESLDRKKAPKFAAIVMAGITALSACSGSNNQESVPETASISASPNFVPKDISELPSPPAVPQETTNVQESPSNESPAVEQSLDTNYDETEITKFINIVYMHDPEPMLAAVDIAKNPDLSMQLGASEQWWEAQIKIAQAYIEADDAVRNLPGDPDSHGFSFGMGFLSKAMLPLYANGLKIAQENNIPAYPENAVIDVTINGQEISLVNLSLAIDVPSPTEAKKYGLCAEIISPIDETLYTATNPSYEGKDEATIEIIKQQDIKVKQATIEYLKAIDVPCGK